MQGNINKNVYIILLNWNGWKDTVECLESVFKLDYPDFKVIVCDNDSQDGSMDYLEKWAEGKVSCELSEDNPLAYLSTPPIPKPVGYAKYDRQQAENGGSPDDDSRLIFIQTGANLGFAGGNNVGMRYALKRDDFDYVWLLNNDTVVKPDALSHMVKRMTKTPDSGICGSTLLYYDEPDTIQALGGASYNKWLGTHRNFGFKQKITTFSENKDIEKKLSYIIGASMLVTKDFIHSTGLMNEDYFLYFEELDWAIRASKKFRQVYSPDSKVYHKEGNSTGAGNGTKAELADYYTLKNRLLFTKTFFPKALSTIYFSLFLAVINRLLRFQWKRVKMIFDLVTGK
jgi:GT2 family glycosyltransferase